MSTVDKIFAKPTQGSVISVTMKWLEPILSANSTYRYTTYTGTVQKDFKWLTATQFVLSTPQDVNMPLRVLDLNYASEVKMTDGSALPTMAISSKKVHIVTGSKGDVYTVTVENNKASCSCSGFRFKRTCRHVKEIQ